MIISLIHPSRGRPQKAKSTYDYWMSMASGEQKIEHILSLDSDEPHGSEYGWRFHISPGSHIIKNDNTCVVEATNKAAEESKGNILIYLSDDFKCPKNWDSEIITRFTVINDQLYDTPILIKPDDCLQKFTADVLTIPIMNRHLYNRLGYFFNPLYRSMFCDQDLYWVCRNNKWIMFCEDLKFPHEHYSNGKAPKDETYIRSDANWNQGLEVYNKRKMEGFPL